MEKEELCNNNEEEQLTKQQKKNKKKREAAKLKKKQQQQQQQLKQQQQQPQQQQQQQPKQQQQQQQPKQQQQQPQQQQSEKNVEEVAADDTVDNFEEELCWCIKQIELGVKTQKPTKDQVVNSTKLLNQLKSPKTPKPKKRMLMKVNFGDYRNKMTKEKKIHSQVPPSFTATDENKLKESVFIKKKSNDMPSCSPTSEKSYGFCFNFPEPS